MVSRRLRLVLADVSTRVITCSAVLLIGVTGMFVLAGMKKAPEEVKLEERALPVEAIRVVPEDVPVFITGYGEVRALNVVSIAAEVPGRIVEVHPRLEPGELIPRGEVLFRIDPRNYEAASKDAGAAVAQWENAIARLEKQYAIDQERLVTLERNRDLAKAEFERLKRLYEEDKVGTQSGVDAAEQAFNRSHDQAVQLAQAVELYPIQIQEARSSLASAEARRDRADTDLERCAVRASFDARVKQVSLEVGQYVTPGTAVLTLADDSVLEVLVPLDSRDARSWLSFDGARSSGPAAWFTGLERVPCQIRWTEALGGRCWEGLLHRVVRFEEETRTITVAVRIPGAEAASADPGRLPLVEGMFCVVTIPGRVLSGVFRVPRQAVTFDGAVYAAVNGRLATVPVEVARVEGEEAFVSGGLQSGDLVITNRLVDPIENTLLDVTLIEPKEPRS